MAASPAEHLIHYARRFQDAGLPYMVVGALAVSAYGSPRATNDVDIVVHLPFSENASTRQIFLDEGHQEVDERQDEFGHRLVVALAPGLTLEVFFTPRNIVYDREYDRRVVIPFRGMNVPFISPEDLVLRKLVNTRLRRGHDYDDAVSILATSEGAIDLPYLHAHCALYRVCTLLERALADANEAARM